MTFSRRRRNPFKSEVELCRVFMKRARSEGLKCYPETSAWDILIVDPETGEQAGVEAKLRANVPVLYQAIQGPSKGPDIRVVLVPSCTREFEMVAAALRLVVYEGSKVKERISLKRRIFEDVPRWSPRSKCWVPPVEVVDLEAGRPAPIQITPWKVKAVRFAMKLRETGETTRKAVLDAGMSWSVWTQKWLVSLRQEGRITIYGPRPGVLMPDAMYPRLTEALGLSSGNLQQSDISGPDRRGVLLPDAHRGSSTPPVDDRTNLRGKGTGRIGRSRRRKAPRAGKPDP